MGLSFLVYSYILRELFWDLLSLKMLNEQLILENII
jgi:hypothetical protein